MTSNPVAVARAVLILVLASIATAVAAWLLPASVHIVLWEEDEVARIALLSPFSSLYLYIAVSLLVVTFLVLVAHKRDKLSELASILSPLVLLLLWVVPYLPLLPDKFPLLVSLAGPFRWGVVILSLFGCCRIFFAHQRFGTRLIPHLNRLNVFVVTLLVVLALGVHVKRAQGETGDEPHYLIISHSLLVDGDLNIENNHAERHYESFHEGVMRPHVLARGVNGEVYSVHAPGLPALMLPFYAVLGRWGGTLFISLLASLTAVAVFSLAGRLTSLSSAVATWLGVVFSVPFLLQGWLVYPEIPAALIMAWVALWIWRDVPERLVLWGWRGTIIALLPWLHTKYSLLLACAALCLLVRLWPRIRLIVSFLLPMMVSGLLWLLASYVMYGTVNPTAAYGTQTNELQLSNIPRGLFGLFVDQEFGLLIYSPFYVLAALGCWALLRAPETRWQTLGVTATIVIFLGSITPFYMWWGGYSGPARFLVPVIPLFGPMVAMGFERCRGSAWSGLAWLSVVFSLTAMAVLVFDPALRLNFNDRDGTGHFVELLQGGLGLTSLLPSFVNEDWVAQLSRVGFLIFVMLGGFIVTAVLAVSKKRWLHSFWAVGFGVLAAGVIVSVFGSMGAKLSGQTPVAQRGRIELLNGYKPDHLVTVSPSIRSWLSEDEFLDQTRIKLKTNNRTGYRRPIELSGRSAGLLAGPLELPAGQYEIKVIFDQSFADAGDVWLRYYRGPTFLTQVSAKDKKSVTLDIALPVELDSIYVGTTDDRLLQAGVAVEILPYSIAGSRGLIGERDLTMVEALDASKGQYVIYLDLEVYPENGRWWVQGGGSARTLLTPGGASQLTVTVRQGQASGEVIVKLDDSPPEKMLLSRRQSYSRTISLDPGQVIVPLNVSCEGRFQPSEYNLESSDHRWLGCYVQIEFF